MIVMMFLWYLLIIGLALELMVHGGVLGVAVVLAVVLTCIASKG